MPCHLHPPLNQAIKQLNQSLPHCSLLSSNSAYMPCTLRFTPHGRSSNPHQELSRKLEVAKRTRRSGPVEALVPDQTVRTVPNPAPQPKHAVAAVVGTMRSVTMATTMAIKGQTAEVAAAMPSTDVALTSDASELALSLPLEQPSIYLSITGLQETAPVPLLPSANTQTRAVSGNWPEHMCTRLSSVTESANVLSPLRPSQRNSFEWASAASQPPEKDESRGTAATMADQSYSYGSRGVVATTADEAHAPEPLADEPHESSGTVLGDSDAPLHAHAHEYIYI